MNSMTFIARIFRFLFWVLIVSWSLSLLRRFLGSVVSAPPRRDEPLDVPGSAVGRKLVRDPVCGMHVAQDLALVERGGGETVYFCSEECRDKFLGEPKKFAANA